MFSDRFPGPALKYRSSSRGVEAQNERFRSEHPLRGHGAYDGAKAPVDFSVASKNLTYSRSPDRQPLAQLDAPKAVR